MVAFLILFDFDFGKMKRQYQAAPEKEEDEPADKTGNVSDLLIPIVSLILFCVGAMLCTGGILDGV